MSFGPTSTTKTAENNIGGISNTLTNTAAPAEYGAGQSLLNLGQQTTQPGVNFMSTLLGGNAANTGAALQPSVSQIDQGTSGVMRGINTLTPRGGGRYGALFGQSFAPQSQIQNLFNSARTNAANTLPGIGLQQQGAGINLFGLGNQAETGAGGLNLGLGGLGQQQQQISNAIISALGSGGLGVASLFGKGGAFGPSSS
jgi:hypothetical protein